MAFLQILAILVSGAVAVALDHHSLCSRSEWCQWCEETFEDRMHSANARYAQNEAADRMLSCSKCTFDFMEPVVNCELEKRDGIHDGPKWTCGAELLEPPCLVYSFGSAGRYDFEVSVRKEKGGADCEMHIFDPNPKWLGQTDRARELVNATYHTYGISGTTKFGKMKNGASVDFRSLRDVVRELNHVNRKIDILKMDVEGAEYGAMKPAFADMAAGILEVDTFLVEMHNPSHAQLRSFMDGARKAGFYMYHKERNNWAICTAAVEFAFATRDFLKRVHHAARCPFCPTK